MAKLMENNKNFIDVTIGKTKKSLRLTRRTTKLIQKYKAAQKTRRKPKKNNTYKTNDMNFTLDDIGPYISTNYLLPDIPKAPKKPRTCRNRKPRPNIILPLAVLEMYQSKDTFNKKSLSKTNKRGGSGSGGGGGRGRGRKLTERNGSSSGSYGSGNYGGSGGGGGRGRGGRGGGGGGVTGHKRKTEEDVMALMLATEQQPPLLMIQTQVN